MILITTPLRLLALPTYPLEFFQQIIIISLETMKVARNLSKLEI